MTGPISTNTSGYPQDDPRSEQFASNQELNLSEYTIADSPIAIGILRDHSMLVRVLKQGDPKFIFPVFHQILPCVDELSNMLPEDQKVDLGIAIWRYTLKTLLNGVRSLDDRQIDTLGQIASFFQTDGFTDAIRGTANELKNQLHQIEQLKDFEEQRHPRLTGIFDLCSNRGNQLFYALDCVANCDTSESRSDFAREVLNGVIQKPLASHSTNHRTKPMINVEQGTYLEKLHGDLLSGFYQGIISCFRSRPPGAATEDLFEDNLVKCQPDFFADLTHHLFYMEKFFRFNLDIATKKDASNASYMSKVAESIQRFDEKTLAAFQEWIFGKGYLESIVVPALSIVIISAKGAGIIETATGVLTELGCHSNCGDREAIRITAYANAYMSFFE